MPRNNKLLEPSSPNEFRFDRAIGFRTGQRVPESGIYQVKHADHRLPHEVTLLKDQTFPRCGKCADLVEFTVVAIAPSTGERRGCIILYELPVLADPEKRSA